MGQQCAGHRRSRSLGAQRAGFLLGLMVDGGWVDGWVDGWMDGWCVSFLGLP